MKDDSMYLINNPLNEPTMKQTCIFFLLSLCNILCYGQSNDSISISVIQPEVYILKNAWAQQINFDLKIENKMSETINLNSIQLSIYDKNNHLVNNRTLRDGPITPSIATIPTRQIKCKETITLYNPFTSFNPYINLSRLNFILSFKGDSGKNFTVEINVKPNLHIAKSKLEIPLKGSLFILDGNDLYANHRRFDINNPLVHDLFDMHLNPELFAVDFLVIDSTGKAYSGDRKNNMNYYIFGQTVYAPAGGKVIKMNNSAEDNIPGKLNFNVADVKTNKDLLPGNCVIIDHLTGEYSFLVHLKKGSVNVKEGDIVKKGQPIGEVGNSGSSMYPHLHYQLENGPSYTNNQGLPIYFHHYKLITGDKKHKIKKGFVSTGDLIENK
jgi:Peptidase family M23